MIKKLNEYLMEPILKCISDKHPYVRKCAILTVPKLFVTSEGIYVSTTVSKNTTRRTRTKIWLNYK